MPDNAARKKRAHMLSRAMGVSYTTALRALNSGSSPAAQRLMGPGDAFRTFGRPVGIIAHPVQPWPMLIGTDGREGQLTGIRLRYGPRDRTDAFVLTDCPLPGQEPYAFLLTNGLHNFVASQLRDQGIAGGLNRDFDVLLKTAPRQPVEVVLDGRPVRAVRICLEGCEAVEIPYAGGSIVFCGREGMSDGMCFGLDKPPTQTPGRTAAAQ